MKVEEMLEGNNVIVVMGHEENGCLGLLPAKECVGNKSSNLRKKIRKEVWVVRPPPLPSTKDHPSDEIKIPVVPLDCDINVSDELADSCHSFCKVCDSSYTLESHASSQNDSKTTHYKKLHGPLEMKEQVSHKCNSCGKIIQLNNGVLVGQITNTQKTKEEEYKDKFTNPLQSPTKIGKQFFPDEVTLHVSDSSPQSSPSTLQNNPKSVHRRSSRRRNPGSYRNSSLSQGLAVEYSSDSSEGSISDIEDVLTETVPGADKDIFDAISCEAGINVNIAHVFGMSADDEMSVDETDIRVQKKIKKKTKKRNVKMSPRRALLLKQTEDKLTLDAVVSPRRKQKVYKKLPLSERQMYHGRNWIPMAKYGEGESEADCDCSWTFSCNKNRLEDFVDVNDAEKTLMNMWNVHADKYQGRGVRHLEKMLKDFVTDRFHSPVEHNLYKNFVCHISGMLQAGLISQKSMLFCVMAMQGIDSTETVYSYSDSLHSTEQELPSTCNPKSIAHLSAIFQGLDLEPPKQPTAIKPAITKETFDMSALKNALTDESEDINSDSEDELYFSCDSSRGVTRKKASAKE